MTAKSGTNRDFLWKLSLMSALLLFGHFLNATQPSAEATPSQVVSYLQDKLIHVMKEGRQLGFKGRYDSLSGPVSRVHGLEKISRIVIGKRQWEQLSEGQRQSFIDAFTGFTLATYASRFKKHNGHSFTVIEETDMDRGRKVVKTVLKKDSSKIGFDYILEQTSVGWQVVNIVVSGISDLAMKRTEYASVMAKNGFDGLVEMLREKTRRIEESTPY